MLTRRLKNSNLFLRTSIFVFPTSPLFYIVIWSSLLLYNPPFPPRIQLVPVWQLMQVYIIDHLFRKINYLMIIHSNCQKAMESKYRLTHGQSGIVYEIH